MKPAKTTDAMRWACRHLALCARQLADVIDGEAEREALLALAAELEARTQSKQHKDQEIEK